MNRITKQALTAAMIFFLILPVAAKDGLYGSAGVRLLYSEDEDISQQYCKAFALTGWQGDYLDISASYNRWISYSITDEQLNTEEIGINQPGADITLYAGDIFIISGGYSFFTGDASYTAHKMAGEIVLDFSSIDISADSSLKNTEYDLNGIIKKTEKTFGGEISFDITDTFSWDIGYIYEYTDYKTYGYTYSKNSGRIGIVAAPLENLFFMSGLAAGIDSDSVKTAEFDAGLTVKFFDHLKLSAAYMLTADFITSESSTTSGGRRGSTTASTTTSSETEFTHTGNISVSLFF